jgi:hypothetical protein
MFDKEIRAIILFFFFSFLDDRLAKKASSLAVDLFFSNMRAAPQADPTEVVVKICYSIWKKMNGNSLRGNFKHDSTNGLSIPSTVDINLWKAFQKIASEEDLLAAIFVKILKLNESKVSHALEISDGTLTSRLSRGFDLLIQLSSKSKKVDLAGRNV